MKRQIRFQIDGKTELLDLAIDIVPDGEEVNARMTIRTVCRGKEILAVGTAYPFEDAFADLQNKLPEGAALLGCVACRYGNLCPVGNVPDEIFCTKDDPVFCKTDLIRQIETESGRIKLLRRYTDHCEGFERQTENAFTYSDFLSYLK